MDNSKEILISEENTLGAFGIMQESVEVPNTVKEKKEEEKKVVKKED